MRILAFSDLHRDVAAAKEIVRQSVNCDVVIGAGDFATKRKGLSETLDIIRNIKVPTLLVAGNHDSLDELRAACRQWDCGYVLHGQSIEINGINFFGLGFEITKCNNDPQNSQMTEEQADQYFISCPSNAVIITHMPPFEVADLQANGSHDGSKAVRRAIEKKQVRLNLCGHIHYAWGQFGEISGCLVKNLGPVVNWFEIN